MASKAVRDEWIGIPSRVVFLVAISGLVLLAVVGLVAVLLVRGADGLIASSANERARQSVGLLVDIGPTLLPLTRASVANLTADDRAALDGAVVKGRKDGALVGLSVFDVNGHRVYPSVDLRPHANVEETVTHDVREALAGHAVVNRYPAEIDPTTGNPTGVLSALEPLRDPDGNIFGAIETSLRLEPIIANSARIQRRIVVFLLGGAALLWLLLMPLTIRGARAAAIAWAVGHRQRLREFKQALDNDEIELVYQPQVAFDGTTVAVEALVRWRRDGRLLSPDEFLPLVEASKLVDALTDRVLHLAIAQAAEWLTAGHPVRVSINLSARNLVDEALPDRIGAILADHQLPAMYLTIEITETAMIEHPGPACAIIQALLDAGISVSLDDFGVGHASIARLRDYRVQELKIDKSFILPADERTRSYAAAMIQFGRSLGLRVVAEGIEDEATLSFIRLAGAHLAQGYYLSRPLTSADATAWLATVTAGGVESTAIAAVGRHRPEGRSSSVAAKH
jgi:EAL domain-containing protein (putative c-di-GMP-specific phosphodiesterase class I)